MEWKKIGFPVNPGRSADSSLVVHRVTDVASRFSSCNYRNALQKCKNTFIYYLLFYPFFLKIAQHDGNVTKWYDAYFNKPRPYFTNEGFPNPPCTEGKTKFSGNEEIYIIGADNACMIPGNEDRVCNGPLKPKKQYL